MIPLYNIRADTSVTTARAGHRRRNECVQCGYSLRGLTEPRCPECGMAFDTPANEATA